jgi:hypothetical protein
MGMTVPIYLYLNDNQVSYFCVDRDRKKTITDEMRNACSLVLDKWMRGKEQISQVTEKEKIVQQKEIDDLSDIER